MLFEEVLPAFRQGEKIRCKNWQQGFFIDLSIYKQNHHFLLLSSLITPIDILDGEWEIVLQNHQQTSATIRKEEQINEWDI
jgi:hypothetical protein